MEVFEVPKLGQVLPTPINPNDYPTEGLILLIFDSKRIDLTSSIVLLLIVFVPIFLLAIVMI